MPVQMRDVALLARVSKTTVSHVLNNTRFVAPETRQRVLDAVQKLKYYVHAHARRLASGSSDFFGILISDILNPFFPEVIKGFETAVVDSGFDILLCTTGYDPGRTKAAARKMIENNVWGVAVLTTQAGVEIAEELAACQIPAVFVDLGVRKPYVSDIRHQYSQGAGQAVNHLYQLGHRDFGFIAGPGMLRSASLYRQALEDALKEKGLSWRVVLQGGGRMDGGATAVHTQLTHHSLPTALICCNDLTAIGAMTALREDGIRIPDEVSVVGSDDLILSGLACPPLTTVRLERERLGKLAFEVLERMVRSQRRRGLEFELETNLVVRQSTGTYRKKVKPHNRGILVSSDS